MVSATISLPVPVSPVISTGCRVGATWLIIFSRFFIRGELPKSISSPPFRLCSRIAAYLSRRYWLLERSSSKAHRKRAATPEIIRTWSGLRSMTSCCTAGSPVTSMRISYCNSRSSNTGRSRVWVGKCASLASCMPLASGFWSTTITISMVGSVRKYSINARPPLPAPTITRRVIGCSLAV